MDGWFKRVGQWQTGPKNYLINKLNGCTDKCMDGSTDKQMDGQTGGWMNSDNHGAN